MHVFCVCVCVCANVPVCIRVSVVHMYVPGCICEMNRLSDVFPYTVCLPASRQIPSLSLQLVLVTLPGQQALRFCLTPFPDTNVKGTHSHTQLLMYVLGIGTQVLMLLEQGCYPLSHLSNANAASY